MGVVISGLSQACDEDDDNDGSLAPFYTGAVAAVAFSSTGATLLAVGEDSASTVGLWDWRRNNLLGYATSAR